MRLIQPRRRKTLNDHTSDPGLETEGVHLKDTLKMDEPIALQTRCKVELQYPSEPRKYTILVVKTDAEMRELPICLKGNELDAERSSSAADINFLHVTCYRNRASQTVQAKSRIE